MIPTFFRPRLARGRTTLVPPILRPEVVAAAPVGGEHLLVYSSGSRRADRRAAHDRPALPRLRDARRPGGRHDRRNITFRPRSAGGFLEDLRTARAVITGGGFSLLSEAVFLGKPVLAVPLDGQFEQLMNARYLEREGFGACARDIGPGTLDAFLAGLPGFEAQLGAYEQEATRRRWRRSRQTVTAAAADDRRRRRQARRVARGAVR